CMYFQMHTCSRPCNNDIDRSAYLEDVDDARAFIEGRDGAIEGPLMQRITSLAENTEFEAAEALRRKVEKVRRARQEMKDTFRPVWGFDYLALLPANSVSRCKVAFIRSGAIVDFKEYEVESLTESLPADLDRIYAGPSAETNRDWQYDEFCLVCNFIL